ncbi:geranylgeranyl transferase type-2 subunit alpha [Trifolium medium]|uniref:Geranylgeranyl transferase type-2 subunit alpha n=1 Tax=Trifolium medium TaxID=97028 RepID=A0A392V276_9FABA|nr:geranylgeranyl transferase type-2 subunit alpha [Trifolium medium]
MNITGNAVADENFTSFIVKVLPTLKYLNDEEL